MPLDAKRILFLGDSITYMGGYVTDLETYFAIRQPGQPVDFINVGLPSETVSGLSEPGHAGGQFPRPDLHERLARILTQARPDLIFACYGMNDGIYQPFDPQRFQKFQEGIRWLREQATRNRAKLVVVTPPTFDGEKVHNLPYSDVLKRYSAWLLEQRKLGWLVVDVQGPMNDYLAKRRKTEPAFAYAADGVHPNEIGHWIIAEQILRFLGAKDLGDNDDLAVLTAPNPKGKEIMSLVARKQLLRRDAWLSATGYKRPGLEKGLPLPEAEAQAKELEKQIQTLTQAKS